MKQGHNILGNKFSTTHGMTKTRQYKVWAGMKRRCNNPNDKHFEYYGKRGIIICESWNNSFEIFWEDMKDGYQYGLTLDRIDNDGDYELSNCRWVSRKDQAYNRRNNVIIEYGSCKRTIRQWAKTRNIKYSTLKSRFLNPKWSIPAALFTPIGQRGKLY